MKWLFAFVVLWVVVSFAAYALLFAQGIHNVLLAYSVGAVVAGAAAAFGWCLERGR
jgi:hypothetical protein